MQQTENGGRVFTGIIEEVGTIGAIEARGAGSRIRVNARTVLEGTRPGDSISTNGVCLTVTTLGTDHFTADVMPETISRTSFAELRPGSPVNLERAAVLGERIGGHLVSGHIDGTGTIASITQDSDAVRLFVNASESITAVIVEKGSIALEGISLTVASVGADGFEVSLIPHTFVHTNLGTKRVGSLVNLENDLIGKYVFRALTLNQVDRRCAFDLDAHSSWRDATAPSTITLETLIENGF